MAKKKKDTEQEVRQRSGVLVSVGKKNEKNEKTKKREQGKPQEVVCVLVCWLRGKNEKKKKMRRKMRNENEKRTHARLFRWCVGCVGKKKRTK